LLVVIVTQKVEKPVEGEELQFGREGMAGVTRLPAGGRERNDDVAELFGIRGKSRGKGQHIRRPVDVTELTIQRSDPRVGDERNREIAARPRRSDAAQPGC
jgi:hypothetical protein